MPILERVRDKKDDRQTLTTPARRMGWDGLELGGLGTGQGIQSGTVLYLSRILIRPLSSQVVLLLLRSTG